MARFTVYMLAVLALVASAVAEPMFQVFDGETGELVSLGAKGSFRMPAPLAPLVRAPRYERLPIRVLDTRYLEPIVRTHYIDQDIIQPKEIRQPILQQRIVEQPVIRQQTTKQPIRRQVIDQTFIRPHVIEQTHITPVVRQQEIVQQRVIEQDTLKEKFQQTQKAEAPIVQAPTFKGAKGAQLYNPLNSQSADENMDNGSQGDHMDKHNSGSF